MSPHPEHEHPACQTAPAGAGPSLRREHQRAWEELERLALAAERRGLPGLDAYDLRRLPALYQHALASLATARLATLDRALVAYLTALATRAYLLVHGEARRARAPLRTFAAEAFPRAARALGRELALATGAFALGGAVACALVHRDPAWFYGFVDPGLAAGRDPAASTEALRAALYSGGHDAARLSAFSAQLFAHNARAGVLAFALGFAAGVPTVVVLFENGLVLGAFVALYADRGLGLPALGWLLPHALPELTALVLCGAAGLSLGRAVVFPGERPVGDALRAAGRRAALVVAGAVVLFAAAGVCEGALRQLVLRDDARAALAALNAAWIGAWLLAAGRAPAAGAGETAPAGGAGGKAGAGRAAAGGKAGADTRSPPRASSAARVHRGVLGLVTPEGVPVALALASLPERAAAFALDAVLLGALVALLAALDWLGGALVPVALFAARYGYFAWFEARRQGATPGKRALGIRVVAADGGALDTGAVLARTLLRDVELVLPAVAVVSPATLVGDAPAWMRAPALAWVALALALPLLTRGRARAGDLVAGTRVVRLPPALPLPPEPTAHAQAPASVEVARARFAPAQLAVYGEHELEVLAGVLRAHDADPEGAAGAVRAAAAAIARKIGFAGDAPDREPAGFLGDFYRAQRAALETRLVLTGERKASQHARARATPG